MKIAVVTGANKGIGFAIVKNLSSKFDGLIYLTSRNEELGKKALNELVEKHDVKNIAYHQLDIASVDSIDRFAKYIKEKYGHLDILINNAAIADTDKKKPFKIQTSDVIEINYFGTLNLCNALFPLLSPNARVVNVTSDYGHVNYIENKIIKEKLLGLEPNFSIDEISQIMSLFKQISQEESYPNHIFEAYMVSKNGLNALTEAQQRIFDGEDQKRHVIVNAINPGDTSTDMNKEGKLKPDEVVDSINYLALLPEETTEAKGKLWHKNRHFNWRDTKLDLAEAFEGYYPYTIFI